MKQVYISSPIYENTKYIDEAADKSIEYAYHCCRTSIYENIIPISPILMYYWVLNFGVDADMEKLQKISSEFLKKCDEVCIMGTEITENMKNIFDDEFITVCKNDILGIVKPEVLEEIWTKVGNGN